MAMEAMESLTVAEAAGELGVTTRTVSRWLATGRLRGEWRGRQRAIPMTEVMRLALQQTVRQETYAAAAHAAAWLGDYYQRRLQEVTERLVASAREVAHLSDKWARRTEFRESVERHLAVAEEVREVHALAGAVTAVGAEARRLRER